MRFIAAKEAGERMKWEYEMYDDNRKKYKKLELHKTMQFTSE